MTLIASLSLLLVFAHLLGWIAERLGQPALLGHMLAGIVLGPSVLAWIDASAGLTAIVDLSVLFVVITAGLKMRFQDLLETFRGTGSFALTLGFIIPAFMAGAFAFAIGLDLIPGLVVALCISVTALPVALRILSDLGISNTRVARVAIASALVSDTVVLMVLGVVIAASLSRRSNGLVTTALLAIAKLALLLVLVAACYAVIRKLSTRAASRRTATTPTSVDTVTVLTLVFMLGFGAIAERLGSHAVIGTFLAALLITRTLINDARFENLARTCDVMTVSVFGPLFLAFQGIQLELTTLNSYALVVGLILVAIVSKWIGGYAAARLKHLPANEAVGVAIIMNARGVMEMVVVSVAYRAGLVDPSLFSALLVVGVVTTVVTPSMLKRWLARPVNARIREAGESISRLEGRV
jgi:Kef-type K+ transport system membrane component KefB